MENQEFHESHRMVPKTRFTGEVDEDTRQRSRIEFKKCLTALGLDIGRIMECFKILSTCESEKFGMMEKIPGGFETWATIGMFMRDKNRVDGMYLRMSLRTSSHKVRSTLEHESFMKESQERIQRTAQLIRKLKGEGSDELTSDTPTVSLSPSVLTNKAFKRTRKNLFDAFLVAYYNSEQSNTSPGMSTVINHWRGVLDAHRVSLRLDGKHEYPQEVFHGDIFLKILWEECQPKSRGRKAAKKA